MNEPNVFKIGILKTGIKTKKESETKSEMKKNSSCKINK